MKRILYLVVLISVIPVLLGVTGCGTSTKISDITADPEKYENTTVTVQGTVGTTQWFDIAEKGIYQLGDGTDTIWIITSEPPPQQGEKIKATGKIQSAFSLLGKSYGTILMETERK